MAQVTAARGVTAAGAAGLSIVWAALLMSAPLLGDVAAGGVAVLYAVGSLICHQQPERSFHLAGSQLPVCARCLGLYAGAAIGLAGWWMHAGRRASPLPRDRAAQMLAVAALPTLITVASAGLNVGDPPNTWRALLALPLGAAAGLVGAAVLTDHLK